MKSNFFKAVAFAFAVLCGSAANAQNNESDNVQDTTVTGQVINQRTRPAMTRVEQVITDKATNTVTVIYKSGAVVIYGDSAVTKMADQTLDGILDGSVMAIKRNNKNYDGELRRCGYLGIPVGAIFGNQVDPMLGLMAGYRTWNWDFSLSGSWTQGHLPTHADNPGASYNSVYFYLDATWKALHTSNGYWSFGPGLGAGYGMQKTNDLDLGGSTNSGVTGRAFLAMNWQATRHLTLGLKAGAMLKVLVDHAENGTEWQEISKNTIKPFIAAEVKVNF